MKIEVLGTGCPKCRTMEENVRAALAEIEVDAEVTKVTDVKEIAARGALMTPGLTVDGKLVSAGHLLSVSQLRKVFEDRGLSAP